MFTKIKFSMMFLALMLIISASVYAQSTTADDVRGRYWMSSKKSFRMRPVKAREVETNTSRTITTDGEGRYRFPNLPIGTYELTVEAQWLCQA